MITKNKISDIILSGAVGDAYGYKVEFEQWPCIVNQYGEYGIQLSDIKEWIVSDDTQMTLFTLYAILTSTNNYILPEELKDINQLLFDSYRQWLRTQTLRQPEEKDPSFLQFKELYQRRAPGITCLEALSSGMQGNLFQPLNDSKGSGCLMRTAPLSFLDINIKNLFKLGMMQASLTHGDKDALLSTGFFNSLLKCGLYGDTLENGIKKSMSLLMGYDSHHHLFNLINKAIYTEELAPEELYHYLGAGWVADEALAIAIYSVIHSDSYEKALHMSVNHSGDSDTTGSLTGQLYAAYYDVPSWIYSLNFDVKESITWLLNKVNYVG